MDVRHRRLNLLTAVSLLLCVACVAMSVRSYFRYEAMYPDAAIHPAGCRLAH